LKLISYKYHVYPSCKHRFNLCKRRAYFLSQFLICMRNSQIIYLFLRHFSFKLLCFKKLLQTDLQQKLHFYSYLKKAETPTLFILIFKLKFFGLKFQIWTLSNNWTLFCLQQGSENINQEQILFNIQHIRLNTQSRAIPLFLRAFSLSFSIICIHTRKSNEQLYWFGLKYSPLVVSSTFHVIMCIT
jgi:hypothetical protein